MSAQPSPDAIAELQAALDEARRLRAEDPDGPQRGITLTEVNALVRLGSEACKTLPRLMDEHGALTAAGEALRDAADANVLDHVVVVDAEIGVDRAPREQIPRNAPHGVGRAVVAPGQLRPDQARQGRRDSRRSARGGLVNTRACTGVAAQWCPEHGDCTCPPGGDVCDSRCPLHGFCSTHGETVYSADALEAIVEVWKRWPGYDGTREGAILRDVGRVLAGARRPRASQRGEAARARTAGASPRTRQTRAPARPPRS